MDAVQAIKSRVSIRKYQDRPVPREILQEIADCGRMAPCGYNRQDWIFVVVTAPELRSQIAQAARYGRFIREAGACFAVFCKKGAETLVEDACAATENMIIAAQSYHLGSCWVNSHRKDHSAAVQRLLACPPDYKLITLLAVGYPDESGTTPKKPLSEVMRWNSF